VRPALLVLDEPTAHLDPPAAHALIRDVFAAAGGTGVLVITHRPEGLEMVDTILELRDGTIGEIAHKGNGELGPLGGFDRRSSAFLADVGKHRADALTDQGLRDRAADAVAGAGYQRRLALGIKGGIKQAHGVVTPLARGYLRRGDGSTPPNAPI